MDPSILPLVRSLRRSTRTHWWASSNLCTSPKEEPWDNNWTTKLSSRRNNSPYTHNILYHREKPLLALAKPLGSSDSTPWFSFTVPGSSSLLSVVTLGLLWTAVWEWKVVVTGVGVICWGNGLIWSLLHQTTTKWVNDWSPQGTALYLGDKSRKTKEHVTLLYELSTHIHTRKHEGTTWNVNEYKRVTGFWWHDTMIHLHSPL